MNKAELFEYFKSLPKAERKALMEQVTSANLACSVNPDIVSDAVELVCSKYPILVEALEYGIK